MDYLVNFDQHKLDVVKFLNLTLVLFTVLGWILAVGLLLSGITPAKIANFAISTLLLTFFVILRLFLNRLGHKRTFFIISVLLLATAFYTLLLSGTANAIGLMLLVIVLITSAIVFDIKVAITYGIAEAMGVVLVLLLHRSGFVVYFPYTSESLPATTIIIVLFIALFINIVRLGYAEIARSYMQSRSYAAELTKLNTQLDKLVKLRTKQLEQSYQSRVDSVYKAAVMGMVSQPMLHDLSTPISALKGALSIIDESKNSEAETLQMAKLSLGQIERIVENGRQLMTGTATRQSFNISQVLNNAVAVIKNELNKSNIVVTIDCDPEFKMRGNMALFERITINLLLNSIEELKQTDKNNREIKITVKATESGYSIVQEDNGRGINPDILPHIFDADFSSKSKDGNLGLGLAFVKQTMEKAYKGSVSALSDLGQFTRFELFFPTNARQSKG